MNEADNASGWAAIDDALRQLYGDTEPSHWGRFLGSLLGGPDPLDGVSAYPRLDPVPHWHYVAYGMSELYTKESDNPDVSGWGFEFTFRLARDPAETEPPIWAAQFLGNLARYAYESGNSFAEGHHIDANGPIALERPDSLITAAAFTLDPELGEISTPHGHLRFLQVIGLADDEFAAAQEWDTRSLLRVLEPRMPLFVTDIDRASLLDDPAIADTVMAGRTRDGSSTDAVFVDELGCTTDSEATTVRLGSLAAPKVARMLAARLPYGRELYLIGPDSNVKFVPGDRFTVTPADGDATIEIAVPLDPVNALDGLGEALRSEAGTYPVPSLPGLTVAIEPRTVRPAIPETDGMPVFSPPEVEVLGLAEPDIGAGVEVQWGHWHGGSWSVDLYYGDPLSPSGPFVWIHSQRGDADLPPLVEVLAAERERLLVQAWLGDVEPAVTAVPGEVTLAIEDDRMSADGLFEGELLWAARTVVDDTVLTVVGRGIDIGRVRLRMIHDLQPYRDRLPALEQRMTEATRNRPDPPNLALDGRPIEALRAVQRIGAYEDKRLYGWEYPNRRSASVWVDSDAFEGALLANCRDRAQAIRELRRLRGVSHEDAGKLVGSATEHVGELVTASLFDDNPALRERACDETLRYHAYGHEVSSQRAQQAWDRKYALYGVEFDDPEALFNRQDELTAEWWAEWKAWVEDTLNDRR